MVKKIVSIVGLIVVLMFGFIGISPADTDTNLLENSGFEYGSTNWNFGSYGSGGGTAIVDTYHSHTGSNSAFNHSSTSWTAWNQNTVSGLAAGTYTATGWVKSGGTYSELAFQVKRNGNYYDGIDCAVNGSWSKYTIENISVSEGDSITVQGYMEGDANAWINWDDFTLTATAPTPEETSMPVGDLPGWHQIFADDFNTDVPLGNFPSAVSDKWDAYPAGWHDTSGNGEYNPEKVVSIANGKMNLYIHTENGVHYVAAPCPKLPTYGQLYGRYSVRFRADSLHGYKTAWLLWPDSEVWPRDGEIDFPEGNLDQHIYAFMHRQNGMSGDDQDGYATGADYGSWHIATIEWSPTHCKFILDGVTIGDSTKRIPNTSMHYVLQTETTLSGFEPADSVAGNVEIDWVTIYSYDP